MLREQDFKIKKKKEVQPHLLNLFFQIVHFLNIEAQMSDFPHNVLVKKYHQKLLSKFSKDFEKKIINSYLKKDPIITSQLAQNFPVS